MKFIVFFIGLKQLENYSFNRIQDREKYRFVCIMSESDRNRMPENYSDLFDKIYSTPSQEKLPDLDLEGVIAIVNQEIHGATDLEKISIICQDETHVMVAAQLRTLFNIGSGIRFNEIKPFRNKMLMKEILAKSNIRVPRNFPLNHTNADFNKIVEVLGLPFIMKPIDSSGSFGVKKIQNAEEFTKMIEAIDNLNLESHEVEEFISGKLFHWDSAAKNKKLLFMEGSLYNRPPLEFLQGNTLGSIPLLHDDPFRSKLVKFATESLFALGMPEGLQHMEIFLNDQGDYIFLEVAARAPGFIASKVYANTFNQNPLDIDLNIEAGINFIETGDVLGPSFWAIFPLEDGVIKELIEPELESNYQISWRVQVGQTTQKSKSLSDISALVFVSNPNYEKLKKDFQKISVHKATVY